MAIDIKLSRLANQAADIRKRDFLVSFREMVKPITWAPELTENLRDIKLTAWVNTYEEQTAKFAIIKELELSAAKPIFCFPERGCQIHLDCGDLYITCYSIERLPAAIEHYGLNVADESDTVKEIDCKIDALSKLKEICIRATKNSESK